MRELIKYVLSKLSSEDLKVLRIINEKHSFDPLNQEDREVLEKINGLREKVLSLVVDFLMEKLINDLEEERV